MPVFLAAAEDTKATSALNLKGNKAESSEERSATSAYTVEQQSNFSGSVQQRGSKASGVSGSVCPETDRVRSSLSTYLSKQRFAACNSGFLSTLEITRITISL